MTAKMVSTDAVTAMKMMAADPKKRPLLDTTCMGGLVLVLSNPEPSVVILALETLLLLSEDKESRPTIAAHIGILEQLEVLLHRSEHEETVQTLADQLYGLLTETPATPLRDSSNSNVSRTSGSVKGKGSVKSTKSVVLQIRGIQNQADRDLCIRLLLHVKGVVSVTFDSGKKQFLLRTKPDVRPESLVRAVTKSMTMSAQQVIRNENGDESLVAFNVSGGISTDTPAASHGKENDSLLPPYLSDDEEEKHVQQDDKNAISTGGTGDSTASRWFSAAASFLTNSFYW
ncbi:armadillo repeat-containing protein 1-like [Babylonia areolata]|uniref:armadillo repeat-containing protein 1-like n=1 Tax=Babylonia areolata TaxID=304850 RepID=UPI003FCF7CCA